MPLHDHVALPIASPPVVIPIGPHEFSVYLGATENGRRLVDLVEVTPPLPKMVKVEKDALVLVLSTALRLEGYAVDGIARDRFMGIKDGLVAP